MKILFVSTWFPYPLDNGSRIRVYQLLGSLAEMHQVHLVSFLSPELNSTIANLSDLSLELVKIIPRDPFFRKKGKGFIDHLSLIPRDIILLHSKEMQQAVLELHKRYEYDLIIASTLNSVPYVKDIYVSCRVLEEHNFTTRWMEERYRKKKKPVEKIGSWITWQKCRHYETKVYPDFQAVTMVSEKDRSEVYRTITNYKGYLEVIPNGVDLKSRTTNMGEPDPNILIFNGSLTYEANEDAMKYFIFEILPFIRKQKPDTRLVITGQTRGVDVSWVPKERNIQLTGYIEDIRSIIANSWACVVPLRDGGGTRLKILEAMALGTPVISTTKGAEGLEIERGKHILIADEPNLFAQECIRLMDEPNLRNKLSHNGRSVIEQKYGWDKIGRQFRDLIERIYDDFSTDRRKY